MNRLSLRPWSTASDWLYFGAVGIVLLLLNLSWFFELVKRAPTEYFLLQILLAPLLEIPFFVLAWSLDLHMRRAHGGYRVEEQPARFAAHQATRAWDAVDGEQGQAVGDRSTQRLWPNAVILSQGLSLLIVGTLAWPILLGFFNLLGLPTEPKAFKHDGSTVILPFWVPLLQFQIQFVLFGGVSFGLRHAWLQLKRRELSLKQAQAAQLALSRQVLESRLSALQAQVEPRFLFDTLVDVQALYASKLSSGSDALDALIQYLRLALPGMRESGSTLKAECDRVIAYLGVLAKRAGSPLEVQLDLPDPVAGERFYPMILLPLIQRAVRHTDADASHVPESVCIRFLPYKLGDRDADTQQELSSDDKDAHLIEIVLSRQGVRYVCPEGDLDPLRDRLRALYADHQQLICEPRSDGSIAYRIRWSA